MKRAQIVHSLLMVIILLITSYFVLRSWFYLADVSSKKDFMESVIQVKESIAKVCAEGGYRRTNLVVPRNSALVIYGCQEIGGARIEPKDGPALDLDGLAPIMAECLNSTAKERKLVIIHATVRSDFFGLSKKTDWRYQTLLCGKEFYGSAFGGGSYAADIFQEGSTVFLRPEGPK